MIVHTIDQLDGVSAVPADVVIGVRGGSSGDVHIRRLFADPRIKSDQRAHRAVQHRKFLHFRVLEIGSEM